MIHSINLLIVVARTSRVFENIVVAHFTELNFPYRFASCIESWTHLFWVFAQLHCVNDVK